MRENWLISMLMMVAVSCFPVGPAVAEIKNLPDRLEAAGWSGVLLIHDGSDVLLHQGFGHADLEGDIANDVNTQFPIASITKIFTSVLILQLSEQGKIDLSASVATYLPDYKIETFDQISIHQLLNHTSGLAITEALEKDKNGVSVVFSKPMTGEQIVNAYLSGPLRESEDRQFEYNNGDYIILGQVIETVAGMPYEDFLKQQILEPLGLGQTGLISSAQDMETLAKGYHWDEDTSTSSLNPPMHVPNYAAAGAMYSTASEVNEFVQALFDGRLIGEDSLSQFMRTYPESGSYGYGAWIRYPQYNRTVPKVVRRYGRIFGFSHLVSHFVDEAITIVVLSNTDKVNPTAFEEIVGGILFQ